MNGGRGETRERKSHQTPVREGWAIGPHEGVKKEKAAIIIFRNSQSEKVKVPLPFELKVGPTVEQLTRCIENRFSSLKPSFSSLPVSKKLTKCYKRRIAPLY